jgi:hypothetical protein
MEGTFRVSTSMKSGRLVPGFFAAIPGTA